MKKTRITKIKYFQNLKVKKILVRLCFTLLMIAILYHTFFLVVTTITQKSYIKILGVSFFSINNNLMKDDLNKNDLVITKKVKTSEIEVGDIIAYEVNNAVRVNKVFAIKNDKKTGEIQYVTKSNANFQPDIEQISEQNVIGIKKNSILGLGFLLRILQSKITTFFVLIILAGIFLYNRYLYQKQKTRNRKKKRLYQV